MNHLIPATANEARLTIEAVRQDTLLRLARGLLTPEQIASLEDVEDSEELEKRILSLLQRH